MHKTATIIILSTLLLLVGVSAKRAHITQNEGFAIPAADAGRLKDQALRGDGDAALRLAMDPKQDTTGALYWFTISAEDGDERGMEWLGILLDNRDDSQSKVRACYWLKKSGKTCGPR